MRRGSHSLGRPWRWTHRGTLAVLTLALAGFFPTSSASAAGVITLYGGTGLTYPHHIVTGPDGNLWFTNNGVGSNGSGSIGKMTPNGGLTLYSCAACINPHGITVGPDANLWFVNKAGGTYGTGSVGKITTSGQLSVYNDLTINSPNNITVGPDGALWFTNTGNDTVGRITTGAAVSNYPGPGINHPKGITAGPDGALWFANYSNNDTPTCSVGNACGIGRITMAGVVTAELSCPPSCTGVHEPTEIVTGPDGNLWFTNDEVNYITNMTTAGVVTAYPDSGIDSSYGIGVGSDNALWFTDFEVANTIGRVTTTGNFANYPCGSCNVVYGMAAGPNGDMYFTNHAPTGLIGRASTDYSMTIAPAAGPPGTSVTTVKGKGFQPGETIRVKFGPTLNICTTTAGSDGKFSCPASIPTDATPGTHTIKAKGSLVTAATVFLVTT